MVTPVVYEIPAGTVSRAPDLSHHPSHMLEAMAQRLRSLPSGTIGVAQSLSFIERELRCRVAGRFA